MLINWAMLIIGGILFIASWIGCFVGYVYRPLTDRLQNMIMLTKKRQTCRFFVIDARINYHPYLLV